MSTTPAPKLFISYSWTSDEHAEWVVVLATELRNVGIDVMLDKWDLKEGQDAHHFMEKMVNDPDIKKVILVCDRSYAQKADERRSGVGAETQIITSEVYNKVSQTKFVAVIRERDTDGSPFVPIYFKSKVYIDLSEESKYGEGFEQLVRWIYDKPLYAKPELGQPPSYISEVAPSVIEARIQSRRVLDAIRFSKNNRSGALQEFLERVSAAIGSIRVSFGEGGDDAVVTAIDSTLSLKAECVEVFHALGQYGPTKDDVAFMGRFTEDIARHMNRSENHQAWNDLDFDAHRFVVHELFLTLIAILLKNERFPVVAELLNRGYYVQSPDNQEGLTSFAYMFRSLQSLVHRKQRLKSNRIDLRADLLKKRCEGTAVPFGSLMQADLTLFLRDCVDCVRESKNQRWWPVTLVYLGFMPKPFEMYVRAESKTYFDLIAPVLGVRVVSDLDPLVAAIKANAIRLPTVDYERVSPLFLIGHNRLGTRP